MKKRVAFLASCLGASMLALSSCSGYVLKYPQLRGGELLAKPAATVERLSWQERKEEEYVSFLSKVDGFASQFAPTVYELNGKGNDNFAVSPVSMFAGLSLAAECAGGDTRAEILNTLGVSHGELISQSMNLYRALNVVHEGSGVVGNPKTGRLQFGNSIWVQKDFDVNQACADSLAENFGCYSYRVDFQRNNRATNKLISDFVKEQTNGLIKKDYRFDENVVFTLINSLYLKTIWNMYGNKLQLTQDPYSFVCYDGSHETTSLMQAYYEEGRAFDGDGFTSFYAQTYNGYKIKFLLPDEGVSIDDVFTAENLSAVNSVKDYNAVDDEARKIYYTRCFFPEYEASFDEDVQGALGVMGINDLFSVEDCDLSSLVAEEQAVYCTGAQHTTKLTVDRVGIEGAAVVVIPGATKAGPPEYETVYLDFVVDRSFGFVITDSQNVTLFSGVVKHL